MQKFRVASAMVSERNNARSFLAATAHGLLRLWFSWYWGWYYPYYYPWSVAYAVTTGSVIGEIIDLKNVNTDQKLQVVWTMSLNGALGSSDASNLQRAIDGVNQAYMQSPYLTTK